MASFLEPKRRRDVTGSLDWSFLGLTALVGLPGPDMFCLFHGKRYSPGESWHPYLEPQGLMYCLRCTCSESAHVSCHRLHCPPVHCPQPVTEPQQCCPRCAEPHTPSGLRAPPKSCQHNGTTYQHGEIFSAHELFPSRLPNQCVLCSCTEGQIYCGLTTCPEPGCPAPLPLPDSCCQACKDGSGEKSAEEDSVQSHRGVRHSQDPCSGDGGRKRSPGTPAPTGLSLPLGFSPRHFRPKGAGSTTVKIVLKEKHKKEDKADPSQSEISSTRCPKVPGRVLVHTSVSPSPDNLRRFALEHEASDQVDIYLWKLVKDEETEAQRGEVPGPRPHSQNLPLDSDQESQEARLPERGTALPAAHWHSRRSLERLPSPDPGAEGHDQSRQSEQDIITKT
ncbi:chordin-like protein 2 isoform X5 [Carlito syrichta]|uniref:Chordin-like protein 2 isoform X5 n=1 Tax=Carlito syrichta TaxID=1868482 RepID=A0A3Q0DKE1_CARSF|nr:chordin-like protein 2 isoform X5 [Carlito syrichta]